jgi:hypothetical protein
VSLLILVPNPLAFADHEAVCEKFISALVDETTLHLYVTGLSSLLPVFLSVWARLYHEQLAAGSNSMTLHLFHYNRETEEYESHKF